MSLAVVTMVGVVPASSIAAAAAGTTTLEALKQPKAVPVRPVKVGGTKRPDAAAAHAWKGAPKVTWPASGSADVTLGSTRPATATLSGAAKSAPAAPKPGAAQRAGSLPVTVAPAASPRVATPSPAKIKVTVADHATTQKAGIDGLLLSLARTDASATPSPVKVNVDYAAFRGAYGGDWASRLHLVQLPACALTTPQVAACQVQKPLATTNDTKAGTLTATADAAPQTAPSMLRSAATSGATVLAATAGAAGSTGDYKSTSLQASGSWSAGGSTGAFTWSYPIAVPAMPGGLQPSIGLGYNSQSVDGRTAASNNQPGWLGDGWSYEPGFIERRYKGCEDDKSGGTNTTKVGDLCWYNDNATLSLGGKSTELVHDDKTGWHPADDSGERVEKLTGAVNGDNDGEHWKVTATDGTQYFFGLNRLPGWKDATTPVTHSAWTVPVFGNHSGEPCYNASFASAWCQQAWRWQLDYVVDPHGNAMAYYWNAESNNYARNVSETTGKGTATPYTRGGYLDHIDYGLRSDSVYSAKAMGQVAFATDERCLTGCSTFDATNAKNWPDTPFDQDCKDGAECKDQFSPTFWSRKRLKTITTKILTGGAYKQVDSWAVGQDFPASGDGISTPMWLKSITHTGTDKAGTTAALDPVTFAGEQKANRVDKLGDGLAPFIRLRLSQITTETGATIGVYYSDPGCTATTLPAADATNITSCYPVKWSFEGTTAKLDWFNSYVATQVVEGDNLANTPDKVISYKYPDGAAWAKSTDEFTKDTDRTYSVARGYGLVQTRTGAASDARTLAETRYFRGIDGKDVKDSAGVAVTDREQFAGMVRESTTYNGDDTTKLLTATANTPWRSAATATRTRTGLPDLVAYHTGTQSQQTRTTITGGTRSTQLTRTFDSYGMVATVSETGDTAKVGDEKCTTTSYARNTSTWMLNKVSQTEALAVTCGSTPSRPADVLSDKQTFYDGSTTLGTPPTKGDATRTAQINGKGDGYDTTATTPVSSYDIYGRVLAVTDTYGKTTTTAFTPATGEVPTQLVVTNPLGHTVTTAVDSLRAQPTSITDANGRITASAYDPLGRLTKVWLPTRSAITYPDSPSSTYSYQVRNDRPIVVTTSVLNHNSLYETSYAFYDGLLRPRQTQSPSPDSAGRLLTETSYDTRGLAWRSSGTYYADGSAEAVLVTGQELNYPASADTLFDGAGRTTAVIAKKFGDETKRVTTSYTGDTTTVIPPAGGTATTTVSDALGRTTELRQYTDAARTSFQSTTNTFNAHGQLAQVKDPSGAVWKYSYDVRGRQTHVEDPDKGASDTVYDAGDRATDATDARKITLHTDYDALGRPTALKQGATTLSGWTYDTATGGKGQPATATRYVNGDAYVSTITAYNALNEVSGSQVTIPANTTTGALANTYKWSSSYNLNTGAVLWAQQPAAGGLPQERITPGYTTHSGLLDTLGAGTDTLVSKTTYDHYGRNTRTEYGVFGKHLWTSSEYDEHTGALTRQYTDRDLAPQRVNDTRTAYDPAGNVTSINEVQGQDAAAVSDTQCFTTDALRRITDAWTATASPCATSPSDVTVGGKDAYWTSYSYDPVGNRKTETQHKTASGPASDTTRTYTAPATGTHNLPAVTQTGTGAHSEAYAYDEAGNTKTRDTGTGGPQTLTWNAEGHLDTTTQGTSTSTNIYDTTGQRLIRKDSTGTTLYLPGGTELQLTPAGTVIGTRYYSAGAQTIAMRTAGKITFLLSDPHGTNTTQVDATTQAVTTRKTTIFGAPRGTTPTSWNGDKGFVGGTKDTGTGLTHIGAREYDPAIGRFVSVDPLMDLTDPQSLGAYAYADNNPVSQSDPTGLYTCRNGHEGCNEHGNACGSDCSPWATQAGDCVETECGPSKINQNPDVSLQKQHEVSYHRQHCDDLCPILGISSPKDSRWQEMLANMYGPGGRPMHDTWAAEHAQELSVAFTPHPKYSYETSEFVGPNSLGSPEEIMAYFKAHPQAIFPFKVTGCDSFTQGATCLLHPGDSIMHGLGNIAGGPGEVTVSIKDRTSFTFTVTGKGYFDDLGSQIQFSISSRDDGVYLTQKAYTTGSNWFAWFGVKTGAAASTWQDQASNLRSALENR
ncbi:RHS repeat domain-containing protein [Streptomyces sp. H39-C1]|uniref:RHS repeat domain-containing protein n=1 Tax=Streptomyces sp. H39-C1 TaxID=3004355 RepID=UPI0022B00A61|nr:RHS repeat-associated core domain-containing protein [Streptomyces sp. H39-C1]